MLEYKMAPCDLEDAKEIGHGGNGKVVLVPDSHSPEKVVKYFCVDPKLSKELKERRYKRFCREIKVQECLGKSIKGILPVYDYCCSEEFVEEMPAWFMMPRATKFNVTIHKSIVQKLEDMLELGRIINEIHACHMAHRDIKPENILIMNNQIYLSDYGMVWIGGEGALTHAEERLGPIKIMPPELDIQEDVRECDYTKSDVYLFAKVLWMYLKRDKYGFKKTRLTLRDLGQLWAYCKLIDPDEAFLLTSGELGSLNKLLNAFRREDLLDFGDGSRIKKMRVGKWDVAKNTVDYNSLIPKI